MAGRHQILESYPSSLRHVPQTAHAGESFWGVEIIVRNSTEAHSLVFGTFVVSASDCSPNSLSSTGSFKLFPTIPASEFRNFCTSVGGSTRFLELARENS